MITRFRVQNYKALRDVTLDLTPIHVLIGPNDSGKTSILEAIAALCRSVDHELKDAFTGRWDGRELVWRGTRDLPVVFDATVTHDEDRLDYHLSCDFRSALRQAWSKNESVAWRSATVDLLEHGGALSGVYRVTTHDSPATDSQRQAARLVRETLAGMHFHNWNPSFLSLPAAIDSQRRFRMEASGFGLVTCLDDILSYDRERFTDLENRFRDVFRQIRSIKLLPEPAYKAPLDDPTRTPILEEADGKGLHFEFGGRGAFVPASQASDGMLLVLAYLALLHLPQPPRVILVEEPENGIHPKRLQDVLKILRELVEEQSHTQVILTTHSPYVVDMFQPEEVTLCQQEEDGSISVRRLSESETVRQQLDVFTLGEIWTAEGDESLIQSIPPGKEATP